MFPCVSPAKICDTRTPRHLLIREPSRLQTKSGAQILIQDIFRLQISVPRHSVRIKPIQSVTGLAYYSQNASFVNCRRGGDPGSQCSIKNGHAHDWEGIEIAPSHWWNRNQVDAHGHHHIEVRWHAHP